MPSVRRSIVLAQRRTRIALLTLTFLLTFALRVRGISGHFWLLGDQIRDWSIALGPIRDLPLIGPPTHVHGHTIGPAFYWILWCIRILFGPWFHNLPHAGGIGQAMLQSAVDALLLIAVWKRTHSIWLALTAVAVLATAPFDLALAAVIWNPVVGSILAKTAFALILLDWHRQSLVRVGVTAAIAWSAVHAYTGAVFVALSVFAALLIDGAIGREWRNVWQRGLVIAGVIGVLQIPYALYQISTGFADSGMTAVTSSLAQMLSGEEQVRLSSSATYYVDALTSIHGLGASRTVWLWILLVCAATVAVRYRTDPSVVTILLLPQVITILGYALWFADLDSYYYLSLAPPAVLTILLGVSSLVPARLAPLAGIILFAGALALVPARAQTAATMFSLPEYRALVAGSQEIIKRRQPIQSIRLDFDLPPTSDSEFIFRILGGRIDRQAHWRAVIFRDGRVEYLQLSPGGS